MCRNRRGPGLVLSTQSQVDWSCDMAVGVAEMWIWTNDDGVESSISAQDLRIHIP